VDLDDAYVDNEFNNQNFMVNKDSTSVEEVVADGFDSDFENKFSDDVPPACTISSHFLHDNDDDQDDNDDDDDANLVHQMLYRTNQISTSNLLGCNKYYECYVYTSNPQSK
jgi:hypothetical protein